MSILDIKGHTEELTQREVSSASHDVSTSRDLRLNIREYENGGVAKQETFVLRVINR